MGTRESVIAEGSATPSIQHEIDTPDDEVTVSNNLLNNLVVNLEEFEELVGFDIERIYKKFEEKITIQSNLIDSLRARIEYLEIDAVVKDEDIKKLRHEIHESSLTVPAQVTTNENEPNGQFINTGNIQNQPETIVNCKKCGKKFTSYVKYHNHVKEAHNYKCGTCHQVFKSKTSRKKHMKKAHGKKFPCSSCQKKFYSAAGLKEHSQAKHVTLPQVSRLSSNPSSSNPLLTNPLPTNPSPTNPSPTTSGIPLGFIHEIILYQHPSSKIPPYQLKCNICEEIFDTHPQFNSHANRSHGCKHTCPECSRVFPQKGPKKSHVRRTNKCQFCGKKLRGEGGFVNHCKSMHNHLSMEAVYSALLGIQFPSLQNQNSAQENESNELEATYAKENNDSFDGTEEENEESDDNVYTDEEDERSGDTEDEASDYTGDDDDYSGDENERRTIT